MNRQNKDTAFQWFIVASIANLIGNPLGTILALTGGFDLAQFMLLTVNILSAIAMLVRGVKAWRITRMPQPVAG